MPVPSVLLTAGRPNAIGAVARPGVWRMNCLVASIAFRPFQRVGFFDAKMMLPLAAVSVTSAGLGRRIQLDGHAQPHP